MIKTHENIHYVFLLFSFLTPLFLSYFSQSKNPVDSICKIHFEFNHFFHLCHYPLGGTATISCLHYHHILPSCLSASPLTPYRLSQHGNHSDPLKYMLDHVTSLLKTLSWLPISYGVKANDLTKAYKALWLCCPKRWLLVACGYGSLEMWSIWIEM